jgi:hypothetical protein
LSYPIPTSVQTAVPLSKVVEALSYTSSNVVTYTGVVTSKLVVVLTSLTVPSDTSKVAVLSAASDPIVAINQYS